jgi:hypothetical protein
VITVTPVAKVRKAARNSALKKLGCRASEVEYIARFWAVTRSTDAS